MTAKSEKQSTNRPDRDLTSKNLFPVVGIGASAGGLAAYKKFLSAIPEHSGIAYLLVQHLDPNHESLLPEILQKSTKIPVNEVSDECIFEPDHIYVMPSKKIMETSKGKLRLAPRPDKIKSDRILPIDLLFSSLAEVYESRTIGVVLSGTASDGTKGLKAIKDNGGFTFAQDLESADFSGMPDSAIQKGVVDFVLPPDKIPTKLLELTNIISATNGLEDSQVLDDEGLIRQIITLLRVRKSADFSYYKQTTIRRRIFRRMAITKKKKVKDYLEYLRENKEEQDTLYHDFLIPVTSFFRDPVIFEHLSETFLTRILKSTPAKKTIRIWVAGCSTGEEAFSFAILIKEILEARLTVDHEINVQIFASDLNKSSIEKARLGIYAESEVTGLSEKRLKKYFSKVNGHYQVIRPIRDMCIFAAHNFLIDPPFGKMDLVSCRNVLIYFEAYLQKKALTTFHYVLNPKGLLLLGKSETTSGVPDLFADHSKSDKIYSRKNAPNKFIQVVNRRTELDFNEIETIENLKKNSPDFQTKADKILLKKYAPAGVVVDEMMDIVQYRGKTGPYLEQSTGKPSHNLMALAAQGLAFELRNLLNTSKQENTEIIKENIPVKIDGNLHTISIEVIPLPNTIDPYYLVLFHNSSSIDDIQRSDTELLEASSATDDKKDLRIEQLEQELVDSREKMRNITDDQEIAFEELQSVNEELMSGTEELQSLNEELETSKEELQSTNEELIVLNLEMNSLNEQLEAERNYSESIVANIREPLLVLNKQLKIRTANNAFYKQFKLNEKETVGSLIYSLGNKKWNFPKLKKLLEEVIPENPVVIDYEVTYDFPNVGEMHLLLNAREVVNDDISDNLILLSLEDITSQVKEREKSQKIQKHHTKELEEKIEERTTELKSAIEELRSANGELVNINKELEAYTYLSSHDLKEPLRKIQTFAGRILDKEDQNLSEKGKTYFTILQNAADRMQQLIDELLEFSRLNSSEGKLKTVNLGTIVDEVLTNFSVNIKESKATIEVGEMCEANVIEFQIRQLIHNLISNALKFSKPGKKPHIKIWSRVIKGSELNGKDLQPDKTYCQISVSDNGIGIEKKYTEKIFEVFQKLHGKDEYPGTGIGLATVKKIVDLHNGTIHVKSALNKGSTFDVYIPIINK